LCCSRHTGLVYSTQVSRVQFIAGKWQHIEQNVSEQALGEEKQNKKRAGCLVGLIRILGERGLPWQRIQKRPAECKRLSALSRVPEARWASERRQIIRRI
jgi:hypothetical protein